MPPASRAYNVWRAAIAIRFQQQGCGQAPERSGGKDAFVAEPLAIDPLDRNFLPGQSKRPLAGLREKPYRPVGLLFFFNFVLG